MAANVAAILLMLVTFSSHFTSGLPLNSLPDASTPNTLAEIS
ncbi:hypothetical protein [Shewanella algicola]|nr:hypothetical protein [Shewanella algicola]